MASDSLLSELCSICNTNKPKYCCPRDGARTCSLPCYKRHQKFASCSGKRDPTAYVKKSQLATPAGIDHDYNFLTSIDRSLEKASREVKAKGVETASSTQQRPPQNAVPSWCEDVGVTLIPAPKGLSRQKENQTHRSKKGKNIMWTIEWIEPDNTRSISNGHNEKQSVIEAYHYGTDKVPSKKRKREDEDLAPAKKGITPTADEKDASKEARSQVDTSKGDNIEPKPDAALGIPHSEIGVPATSTEVFNPQLGTSQSETPAIEGNDQLAGADPNPERPSRAEKYERQFQRIPEVPATDQGEQGDQSAGVDVLQQPYHFFLHKPRTSSTRPVLIPITPSSSLRDILRGRTVLEFPTIYVFTSPSPPSESFILEAAYLEQERQEQQELEDALKSVRPGAFPGTHDDGTGQQGDSGADEFDSKRILDVLKQDLGAGL